MTSVTALLVWTLAGFLAGYVVRSHLAVRQQRRDRWQRVEKYLRAERARAVARRGGDV